MIAPADFKNALKDFPGGVTIVTSCDSEGEPCGATVSSFASLSLEPPLVVLCLRDDSSSVTAIRERRAFVVHLLNDEEAALARQFARDGADKFADVDFSYDSRGLPVLSDCTAHLKCELYDELPGGDHALILGLVTNAITPDDFKPLVHARRHFYTLGEVVD